MLCLLQINNDVVLPKVLSRGRLFLGSDDDEVVVVVY
jgi:hypothetical protein